MGLIIGILLIFREKFKNWVFWVLLKLLLLIIIKDWDLFGKIGLNVIFL